MDDGGGLERRERENDGDIIGEAKLVQNRQLREMEGGESGRKFSPQSATDTGFLARGKKARKKGKCQKWRFGSQREEGVGAFLWFPGCDFLPSTGCAKRRTVEFVPEEK